MTPPCKKVKNLLCYLNFDFSDDEVEERRSQLDRFRGGTRVSGVQTYMLSITAPADTPALGRAMPREPFPQAGS